MWYLHWQAVNQFRSSMEYFFARAVCMIRLTYFTLTLLQGFIFKQDREAPARNIRQSLFHGKAVRYPVFRLFYYLGIE